MKMDALWVIRRACLVVIGLGLLTPANAAEVPNVDELATPAREQLSSHFRTQDKTTIQNALISARNELELKARTEPTRLAIGSLLLRTPVSTSELSTIVREGKLIEVVSRTPVGKRGVVYSAGWRIDPSADVSEAVKEGERKFKDSLGSQADPEDPASTSERQELAKKELLYVSARVIARHDQLDKAAARSGVLAVLLQDEESSAREIDALTKPRASKPAQLNRAAPSAFETLSVGDYSDAPLDPAGGVPEAGVGKPCLGQSCWVASYDSYCNTKVGTKKYGPCPANIFWLPGSYGGIVSRDFQMRPEINAENQNIGSNGWSKTVLRWSATAPQIDFGGGQVKPITSGSFLATAAKPCNFQYSMTPLVPCDISPNQIFVADSTYESELLLPNPECTMSSRTGTLDDALAGCYVWVSWSSNLPSAYPDTTFADGPAVYNSAIGSAAMSNLALGVTYTNIVYFRHNRPYISKTGMQAFLSAQIGTRVPASCYTTWCSFQTKAVTLQSMYLIPAPVIREP